MIHGFTPSGVNAFCTMEDVGAVCLQSVMTSGIFVAVLMWDATVLHFPVGGLGQHVFAGTISINIHFP